MPIFEGLTSHQRDWLSSKESLTKRLRTVTQNKITHHLFYNDWGIVDQNTTAWIRRMEWRYENTTWVACTVMIPETSINEETQELLHTGEKSIGDTLFQDPTLTRSDFTFSKCNNNEWGRESIFYYKQQPIFLVEHFYAEFFDAIRRSDSVPTDLLSQFDIFPL